MLQRDPVRTRGALLTAATQALMKHGPNVSLDVVAREAGVSKGGLLHHFRSRDALLVALTEEWLARFGAAVERHRDPHDTAPGALARAHIRATFDPEASDSSWTHTSILTALLAVPGVLEVAEARARQWQRDLKSDGLHPQRSLLVTRALDGQGMADLLLAPAGAAPADVSGASDREALRDLLLAITHGTGPLVP